MHSGTLKYSEYLKVILKEEKYLSIFETNKLVEEQLKKIYKRSIEVFFLDIRRKIIKYMR